MYTLLSVTSEHFYKISSNSEALASKLLENLEELIVDTLLATDDTLSCGWRFDPTKEITMLLLMKNVSSLLLVVSEHMYKGFLSIYPYTRWIF